MKARRWLTGLAMILGCSAFGAAGAQPFPAKPVRIIAPTAAGSAPDIITRLVADRLGRQWGHQVIVENRPGGNGIIGMNTLTRADPDGYTLAMFHAAAAVTTPFLYQAAKFDIERDTEVVATLAYTPMMLVTTPGTPYRSVADLIAAAKGGEASDLVIGSPTRGSIPNLSVYLIGQLGGRQFRQVSFSGTSQALQALIKGDIPVYIDGVAPLVPLVRAGKLVPVAMSADQKLPGFEGIPLVKDTLPGMVTSGWFAIFAPKGTPATVLDTVHAAVNQVLQEPEVQSRLADLGTFVMPQSRAQASAFVHDEKSRWGTVISTALVKAE
ncbi:Bug family tripartite tricarboxylate transporter substrate binding protein [Achromobacter aegrifaciens]